MSCLPGMPCFPVTYSFYPLGCEGNSVFKGYPIISTLLCYAGPILPNSGINPGDSVSVALAKMDNQLSASELVTTLIAGLESNPSLLAALCSTMSACNTTSTTTTIQPSPILYYTSQLTTGYPNTGEYAYCAACPDTNYITTIYTSSQFDTPVLGMGIYLDPGLTIPLFIPVSYFKINWGGPIHNGWDVLTIGSNGVQGGFHCSDCLTTTTTTTTVP